MSAKACLGRLARLEKVLSIETSCDDTSVAVLRRVGASWATQTHVKKTLNSRGDGGIIPIKAFNHHHQELAGAVRQCLRDSGLGPADPPDLVCVTRGPGMPGSLSAGADFAKGLAVGLGVPVLGVHHMLGHLLAARAAAAGCTGVSARGPTKFLADDAAAPARGPTKFSADDAAAPARGPTGSPSGSRAVLGTPAFPYLNLLVSGGHTMVVLTTDLLTHEILCDTTDVAVGDALDKCSREIGLDGETNLGKQMDDFIKNNQPNWHNLDPIQLNFPRPIPQKSVLKFALGCFSSHISRLPNLHVMSQQEKASLAYYAQEAVFDHLMNKLKHTIVAHKDKLQHVKSIVASGGVASNLRLRSKIDTLISDLHLDINTYYPPVELCTDNAVMIGWAGIELYEKYGITTDLSFLPQPKWPLSSLDLDFLANKCRHTNR